ncbi:hypothetical protein H206_05483 [Candidatus Electrothrix aarhusensis]|uniref:Uncharacterized protein n=1 Tax=Candidatus Electrothrix aarhusensis TaxID=1859131 RepID=A0A3S3QHZ5_9BACT|nr:hypothetical protein H206_05483 [Candidatus Electrothrix aarhusensis]
MAGCGLGEQHLLTAVRELNQHGALTQANSRGYRFIQPSADARLEHHSIHHHLNGMKNVFLELDLFTEWPHLAVHPHPDITVLAQLLKDLLMAPLFANHQRREQDDLFWSLRPLRTIQQGVDHVLNGLGADGLSAFWAMGLPGSGKEQAQVVIDLGHRAHRGSRIPGGGLLLNGNRRRQALQQIHVWLVHLPEELAGIGGQRFHVATLPSAYRVSKARVDFPEPDRPVKTTSWLRGKSTEMFFRLCIRAPRTEMYLGSEVTEMILFDSYAENCIETVTPSLP